MGVLLQLHRSLKWFACFCGALAAKSAFTLLVAFVPLSTHAQVFDTFPEGSTYEPRPLQLGSITLTGEVRGRGEGWNWFLRDTRARYAFGHSLLLLSIAQQKQQLGWKIELAQPTLYHLPNDAFVPATGEPLGLGAIYFTANGNRQSVASLFVKQAFISVRGIDRNHSTLALGRFGFSEGAEKKTNTPDLAWIVRQRIAHRLVGDSYWTDIGRSLDGLHFSDDINPLTNLTFVAGRATRGVWQTNGMGELDVDIFYGAYTREFPTLHTDAQLRVFGLGYHDGRRVLKIDNRALREREADTRNIRIGTFGINYALVAPIPKLGKWDLLVWGAEQIGQWGVLNHRANSAVFELGWRPPIPRIHPWLRAGAFYASGDGNPNDDRHTTFFQPLPSENQYARMPFYTLQNTEDYTGQVILQPTRKLMLRSEVHKVKLHSVKDMWYLGSGAFENNSFGYIGLAGNGHRGLGNYLDFSAEYQVNSHFAFRYYIGALSGKGAQTARPEGRKGGFTYLELVSRF